MKFDVLKEADISQQDFADIIGLSRVSVSKLINNGNLDKVDKALALLRRLVDAKKLPRGYNRTDQESRKALVEKLRDRLNSLAD